MSKLRIGLLFGGQSAEHDISLASARAIYEAVDRERFEVVLLRIDRRGYWHCEASPECLYEGKKGAAEGNSVFLVPSDPAGRVLWTADRAVEEWGIDVAFPALHGTNGEDGAMQGLLRMVDLPFVGADVLASAVGMDKDITKRLLREAGLPVPQFRVLHHHESDAAPFADAARELGLPFFLKPANTGSSVGIAKVQGESAYRRALAHAFEYDRKVILEECIEGRELECAVMGNEHPTASVLAEISTEHDFYSYEAKYLDEAATTLTVPADLPSEASDRLRALSVDVYRTLCCEGMARVDWFLGNDGAPYVNEINTIPGFTRHSMFPAMWKHTGVDFTELISRLVTYALERHARDAKMRKTR